MTKIDEVVEREFAKKNDRSFDKSRFVRCYGQKKLRALLQEVHDAAVAECGKDVEMLRKVARWCGATKLADICGLSYKEAMRVCVDAGMYKNTVNQSAIAAAKEK